MTTLHPHPTTRLAPGLYTLHEPGHPDTLAQVTDHGRLLVHEPGTAIWADRTHDPRMHTRWQLEPIPRPLPDRMRDAADTLTDVETFAAATHFAAPAGHWNPRTLRRYADQFDDTPTRPTISRASTPCHKQHRE